MKVIFHECIVSVSMRLFSSQQMSCEQWRLRSFGVGKWKVSEKAYRKMIHKLGCRLVLRK